MPNIRLMGLIDDLKTFLAALALGAALTLSIDYAVVHYTDSGTAKRAVAAAPPPEQPAAYQGPSTSRPYDGSYAAY